MCISLFNDSGFHSEGETEFFCKMLMSMTQYDNQMIKFKTPDFVTVWIQTSIKQILQISDRSSS